MIGEKVTSYILRLCPIHVSNFHPTVWGSYCIWYVTPYHLFFGYGSFCFIRDGFPHTVIQEGKWHSQKIMPITKNHVVGCCDISHGTISVTFQADVVLFTLLQSKSWEKSQWSICPPYCPYIIQLRRTFFLVNVQKRITVSPISVVRKCRKFLLFLKRIPNLNYRYHVFISLSLSFLDIHFWN